jgi:hypothetical protein
VVHLPTTGSLSLHIHRQRRHRPGADGVGQDGRVCDAHPAGEPGEGVHCLGLDSSPSQHAAATHCHLSPLRVPQAATTQQPVAAMDCSAPLRCNCHYVPQPLTNLPSSTPTIHF